MDAQRRRFRYVPLVNWFERQIERLRSANALVVDSVIAALFVAVGIATVFGEHIRDDKGVLRAGFKEPSALSLITIVVICAPIAIRRRSPLLALAVSGAGIFVHIGVFQWPEGALPLAVLLLTFGVATWCAQRQAVEGLALVLSVILALAIFDSPGLDAVGAFGVFAQFSAVWAIGIALRSRRVAAEARISEAEERAEAERQGAARVLAEERLRIAQELHDVVAHSMSVIAVQAGAGAHVLDDRPEQARAALGAISDISRGTLTELRRLLGVLRGNDGGRASAPAPGLADLPRLVDDVRAAGIPVALHVDGAPNCLNSGVELSVYRVVQEALTNVIKHAGAPTKVDVNVHYLPGSLAVEVVDDGRGLAAGWNNGRVDGAADGSGHGHVGMRERVELWGGELSLGPAPGGGFRVRATLPYGERE